MCWTSKQNFGWGKEGFELPVPRILPIFLARECRVCWQRRQPALQSHWHCCGWGRCHAPHRAGRTPAHSTLLQQTQMSGWASLISVFHSVHRYPLWYLAGPMPTSRSPVRTKLNQLSLHLFANVHCVPATDPLCPDDLLLYLFYPSLECYDVYGIV